MLPWLPALAVAALGAIALLSAAAPPLSSASRRRRFGAIAGLGALALIVTVWQVWAQGRVIAGLVRNDPAKQLTLQVRSLEDRLAKLKESTRERTLGEETAAKLAGYLRSFGSRKVVVSCIPGDIEAYDYATEIADVLKAANWDARGPETTMIFGDVRALGVNLYNKGAPGADTAKILLDGFVKFGIPYQSRVPPQAMPDDGTVELFVGGKPTQAAMVPALTSN